MSFGLGLDPGLVAVSTEVISHKSTGRLSLLSATPVVTLPAKEHHWLLAGTKLYCSVTKRHAGVSSLLKAATRWSPART